MVDIERFQVWLVNLQPIKSQKINKTRRCVVISLNEMSSLSGVLVAPMTSGFEFPCRVECDFKVDRIDCVRPNKSR